MQRETFVLTLVYDAGEKKEPRGRLHHVSTGQKATFKNLKELTTLLLKFQGERGWEEGGRK